eukprot:comp20399_c0_seq1/m.25818 comp20399_c0_seq1/g.25818  ORF comp20399_c0_seq1/g.25818 comp20399_c0_seq1/m.25818 type:complete len:468 (-) comp20399_c0_seq1:537-1940(-)
METPPVPHSVMVRNMFAVTFMTFVIESSRGLFVASLWGMVLHVGDGKELNSLLVSLFSVGRMVATLLCGYLADCISEKKLNIFFSLFAIFANGIYLLCYETPEAWLLIVARIGAGMATGPLSGMRSHTAKITTKAQRTPYMALNGAAQFAGVGMAPIIALVVTELHMDESLPESTGWLFGPLAAPATILIILNIVNIIVQAIVFVDLPSEQKKEKESLSPSPMIGSTEETPLLGGSTDSLHEKEAEPADRSEPAVPPTKTPEEIAWDRLVFCGVWLYIFINFAARAVIALIEAEGTPVYLEMIGKKGDVFASSLLFAYLGLAGLTMFAATYYLARCVHEAWLLMSGFVCLLVGGILVATVGQTSVPLLVTAFACIWSVGFPLLSTTIISSFSKVLGTKPQGGMMGWIGTSGSLGRIVMPMLAGVMSSVAVFSLAAAGALVSIVMVAGYVYAVKRHGKVYQRRASASA